MSEKTLDELRMEAEKNVADFRKQVESLRDVPELASIPACLTVYFSKGIYQKKSYGDLCTLLFQLLHARIRDESGDLDDTLISDLARTLCNDFYPDVDVMKVNQTLLQIQADKIGSPLQNCQRIGAGLCKKSKIDLADVCCSCPYSEKTALSRESQIDRILFRLYAGFPEIYAAVSQDDTFYSDSMLSLHGFYRSPTPDALLDITYQKYPVWQLAAKYWDGNVQSTLQKIHTTNRLNHLETLALSDLLAGEPVKPTRREVENLQKSLMEWASQEQGIRFVLDGTIPVLVVPSCSEHLKHVAEDTLMDMTYDILHAHDHLAAIDVGILVGTSDMNSYYMILHPAGCPTTYCCPMKPGMVSQEFCSLLSNVKLRLISYLPYMVEAVFDQYRKTGQNLELSSLCSSLRVHQGYSKPVDTVLSVLHDSGIPPMTSENPVTDYYDNLIRAMRSISYGGYSNVISPLKQIRLRPFDRMLGKSLFLPARNMAPSSDRSLERLFVLSADGAIQFRDYVDARGDWEILRGKLMNLGTSDPGATTDFVLEILLDFYTCYPEICARIAMIDGPDFALYLRREEVSAAYDQLLLSVYHVRKRKYMPAALELILAVTGSETEELQQIMAQ